MPDPSGKASAATGSIHAEVKRGRSAKSPAVLAAVLRHWSGHVQRLAYGTYELVRFDGFGEIEVGARAFAGGAVRD